MQRKQDDAQGIFFQQQLTLIEQSLFQKKYPEKFGRKLVPLDNQGGPGVAFRKWRMLDRIGTAKAINNYADNLPMVSLSGQEFSARVKDYGIGFRWTIREIDEARFAGQPLDTMLANAARDGYEDTFDDLVFNGDVDNGVQGLMDPPTIPIYTPGTSSGSGDDTWPNKTGEEMIADVRSLVSGIKTLTKQTQAANLVWMSPERLDLLRTTNINSTDKTILAYLQGAFPGVIFDECSRLSTMGVGGVQRMLAMQQDKDVLYFWEPQPYTTYPAQWENLAVKVPAKGAVGGCIVRRPLAIAFMDGI